MTNIYNLFKFLEDKKGREVPLKAKLRFNSGNITSDDVNRIYNDGVIKTKGPMKFIFIVTNNHSGDGLYFPLDNNGRIENINLWFNEVEDFGEMPEVDALIFSYIYPFGCKYNKKI